MLFLLSLITLLSTVTSENPWDQYNYSPKNRTLAPVGVLGQRNVISLTDSVFPLTLSGAKAYTVLDFGKEVGGFLTVTFSDPSDKDQSVGLTYSESTDYATCPSTAQNNGCGGGDDQSLSGDHSNGGGGPDGSLSTGAISNLTGGIYIPAPESLRGGFRYLNLFLETSGSVTITDVSVKFTPAPLMSDPSNYDNYFYSSDDLLNKVWYGAAYTTQMCTIDPNQGRQWGPPASGWNNAVLIGSGSSILVDGAKRDRTIWPGDMGISIAASVASIGDYISGQNSLDTLFALQSSDGQLPYVGPEVFCQKPLGEDCGGVGSWISDTYHLWALVGATSIFTHTGNMTWLASAWPHLTLGIDHSLSKIGDQGLMVVDQRADWQRGGQGGANSVANVLLTHITSEAARMAKALNDPASQAKYANASSALSAALNSPLMWDDDKGAFKDNPDSTLYPQDGNSVALWFGVVNASNAGRVSDYLSSNWVELGSASPEWSGNIGTFPGSMELMAHASAGRSDRVQELSKRQWGYMLNHANSTQSTFWEGYNQDGSYNFDGIYMSHSHGWAAGPCAALSQGVLGLQAHTAGGSEFLVAPQPGALEFCEGSLTFPQHGHVSVQWTWLVTDVQAAGLADKVKFGGLKGSESVDSFRLQVNTEESTDSKALIGLPITQLAQELFAKSTKQLKQEAKQVVITASSSTEAVSSDEIITLYHGPLSVTQQDLASIGMPFRGLKVAKQVPAQHTWSEAHERLWLDWNNQDQESLVLHIHFL